MGTLFSVLSLTYSSEHLLTLIGPHSYCPPCSKTPNIWFERATLRNCICPCHLPFPRAYHHIALSDIWFEQATLWNCIQTRHQSVFDIWFEQGPLQNHIQTGNWSVFDIQFDQAPSPNCIPVGHWPNHKHGLWLDWLNYIHSTLYMERMQNIM